MKKLLIPIIVLLIGCTDPNIQVVISNNNDKIEELHGKINFLDQHLQELVEYYDQEYSDKIYENYKKGISYVDAAKADPAGFQKDSLELLLNSPDGHYEFKHHYELIQRLLNSPDTKLIESEIRLEFARLESAILDAVLTDFKSVSFQMNEPYLIIDIDNRIYENGETITGKIFFAAGSNNMKSSVLKILVNGESIKVDETGKGIINLLVDSNDPILNAEIELKYPVNGKYKFETSKNIIIK